MDLGNNDQRFRPELPGHHEPGKSPETTLRTSHGERRVGRLHIKVQTTLRTSWVPRTNRHDLRPIFPGTTQRTQGSHDKLRTNQTLSNAGRLGRRSNQATQQIPHIPSPLRFKKRRQSEIPEQPTPHEATVATRVCKEPKCHGSYPWTYPCQGCPHRRRKGHSTPGRV